MSAVKRDPQDPIGREATKVHLQRSRAWDFGGRKNKSWVRAIRDLKEFKWSGDDFEPATELWTRLAFNVIACISLFSNYINIKRHMCECFPILHTLGLQHIPPHWFSCWIESVEVLQWDQWWQPSKHKNRALNTKEHFLPMFTRARSLTFLNKFLIHKNKNNPSPAYFIGVLHPNKQSIEFVPDNVARIWVGSKDIQSWLF